MTQTEAPARRAELAAFLRSRRARLSPAEVGLAPGLRRRTPGLRREELAQLAGVGVTWYTWLEQGRSINASVQVLDAIARTLRLDEAEREHLYRLADVPSVALPERADLDPAVQVILDSITALPAAVYNGRYDLLAWNSTYGRLFPGLTGAIPPRRNVLWHLFTCDSCCLTFVNRADELPLMVATLRAGFARHLGEPAWTEFVRQLSLASDEFARLWAAHDVAGPGSRTKIFHRRDFGELVLATSSFNVGAMPEARLIVYTPQDEGSRRRLIGIPDFPHP